MVLASLNRHRARGPLHGRQAWLIAMIALAVALAASLLWAVTIGSVGISVADVYGVIAYHVAGIGDAASYADGTKMGDIVWQVRLPRLVLAIAVGAALSAVGCVMQAVVKNPLADPYILGVSSGAQLGATLAILLGVGSALGAGYDGVMAFIGAFLASMAVVGMANVGGRSTSIKLVLSGTALAAICGAISNFLLFVVNTNDGAVAAVVRWTMGSLAPANWDTNVIVLAISVAGALFFWSQYRTLNMMLLGDEVAVTLGADLSRRRILYLAVASLLVGFAVYAAGIIGFVGLVVPHAVRILFGTDHKKLIPLASLTGAIFLLWADVLSRTVIPQHEIPIGILTALVGAPVFVYLMVRRSYGFGEDK